MESKGVVIVEDEPLVAVSLAKKLTRMGLDVMGTYETGREAVSSILKQPPDLVLLDIKLSEGEDGIDVAHEINRTVDIPRIRHGKRQTLDTLINEEALLLGKYLRNERKDWNPRIPKLISS